MTTGPTDARPLQVRVADDVRAKIESGLLQPGTRLPTLDQMARDYLCSVAVTRKAIDLLKQQGLVVTMQGKGAFVRERPKARRAGIGRYSRSTWLAGKPLHAAEAEQQGHTAGQVLRELAEVDAPSAVADRLGITLGTPVFVRRRLTMVDGRPDQLADSYYDLDVVSRAPRIREENTGPGGGFARLEEAGFHLAEISEEWTARMPTGPEMSVLHLPAGTPVLDLIRTTYDSTGRPVEMMLAVIAGDMVSMAYRFPIPD